MVEIVYRIYEVADEKTAKKNVEKDFEFGLYSMLQSELVGIVETQEDVFRKLTRS